MAVVDEAVRRVLRIKLRAGIFERPYADPDAGKADPADARVARGGPRDRRAVDGAAEERQACCRSTTACAVSPSSVRSPTIGGT